MGLSKCASLSNFILSLPEELDFLSLSRLVMIGSVPLLPLSSPCMKSLKLGDQFFIKIYIFVQKKRHTYVIMAESEVTGCVYFARLQQCCYPPSESAWNPPSSRRHRAVAARLRPCLLPLPEQPWESLPQGRSVVSLTEEKEDRVLFVCSSCSLPFAATDLAKLLPVCILGAIIQVRNSQKRKIFIFIFFGVFSKN